MSKSKHYPGPWVDSPEASDAIIAPNMGADPNGIKYYGGALVAETVAPRNRPIIKAAPDLYDALWAILCADQDNHIPDELHKQARAAIAKAKGGDDD